MESKSPPVLLQIYSYAREYRPKILLASSGYSVLNKIFDIAPELLIGFAIDLVVKREKSFISKFGIEDVTHQLILLSVLTFVWGFESLFEYLYKLEWRNLAQKIQHKMRLDGYKNAQDLDLHFFENQNTGNLTTILNDDINQLERFLDLGVNQIIQVLTSVVVIGTLFFIISPLIAVFAFLSDSRYNLWCFWFQKERKPLYAEVRNNAGLIAARRLSNNLSGIATIKSFTAEKGELNNLSRDSHRYMESNQKAIQISSAFVPVIRMAILAGFLTTLALGGWMTLDGQLEVGFYGVLVFMTQRLLWPLTGLAEVFDAYERAMASARRILKLIFEKPKILSPVESQEFDFGDEIRIEYKDVSFSYQSSLEPVLKNISFTVSKGQSIALVGPTGLQVHYH